MNNLIVVRTFLAGGWVMYPILLTSLVALSIIIERMLWWWTEMKFREPRKLEEVHAALEKNDVKRAVALAGSSRDAILRVLWFGLSHHGKARLQSAFQVAAGIELERAGRHVIVLDTIVTLSPLLGLFGTVTGLRTAFFKLGGTELSEQALGGGIAEALIATASGLTIAVVCLVFLNYYAASVTCLQHELQIACGKAEVFLHQHVADEPAEMISSTLPEPTDTSALTPPSLASPEAMNPPHHLAQCPTPRRHLPPTKRPCSFPNIRRSTGTSCAASRCRSFSTSFSPPSFAG